MNLIVSSAIGQERTLESGINVELSLDPDVAGTGSHLEQGTATTDLSTQIASVDPSAERDRMIGVNLAGARLSI